MKLENLATIFKQVFVPVLLLLGTVVFTIVGGLNVYHLLSPLPPAPLEFTSSQNVSQTPFYNLNFNKKALEGVKGDAKVYPANFGLKKTGLESLAQQLGFTGASTVKGEETIFRSDTSRLAFNTNTNLVSYTSNQLGSLPVGFDDEKMLREKAQKVVEGLNLSNLKMRMTTVTYLKTQLENLGEENLPPSAGQIATVAFKWEKDGLLLVEENSVSFDNQGTLLNFVLYPVTVSEESKKYARKNYEELKKEAAAGQFHLTYIEHTDDIQDLAEPLSIATFDKVGLGLVGQPKAGTVQTVYTLSGAGSVGNTTLEVEAVTSAISGVGVKP